MWMHPSRTSFQLGSSVVRLNIVSVSAIVLVACAVGRRESA